MLRRILAVIAVATAAALALVLTQGEQERQPRLAPGSGAPPGANEDAVDPLAYTSKRAKELAAAAARGHAHVLYARSPGGARASAARTAGFRPLVEAAAQAGAVDADLLEAMILLESAGRPAVAADPALEGAVGLTQILAETGRNLLGMRVDPEAARRIGRSIRRAVRRGRASTAARLRMRRARIDERFDPAKSLAATVRYLAIARRALHREDLAVVSYHMGIGNLQGALRAYGSDDISYVQLYFDSSPARHAAAWSRLAALGDDSSTYLFRVAAAREIMRLYRSDPGELDRLAALQNAKNSAEERLHPEDRTERFATPDALRQAYADGRLVALPRALLARSGLRIDRQMGELAGRLKRSRRTYRGLQRPALAMLVYLGAGVKEISGEQPLLLTSTVRDRRYQRLLVRRNAEASRSYSLHTTGWAFDILRRYRSRDQARALQFVLDRLQSHDLIAWVREPAAIHVTVSRDAQTLLGVLAGR